jgi:hypothetical protein
VRARCQANNVDLVFLPTYSFWLNWIEAGFAALRYFALNGTDHRSPITDHAPSGSPRSVTTPTGTTSAIQWHDQRVKAETGCLIGSKIRQPDYLFEVA